MSCGCTAPLRADIIKRFFATDSRREDFALELIRIVECQQTTMSPQLELWFRTYFRFSDTLLNEFLRCVLKQQTTMSRELEKAIRARYFPASQDMANDFIRVALCSCCPEICGTDIDIIGIYDFEPDTPDGWYLHKDESQIIYVESDVATETRECPSRLADYGHPNGDNGGYEAPHVFSVNDSTWFPLTEVEPPIDLGGFDYRFNVYTPNNPVVDFTGGTILVRYSTDGGATWINGATSTDFNNPTPIEFNTGTDTFIYQTIVTLANGCQFFNPAPDTGSPSYGIYYATIDMAADILFLYFGSINGVTPLDDSDAARAAIIATMAEPYQTTAGRLGGIGIDYSVIDGGSGLGMPFYLQIITPLGAPPTELAVVLDSLGAPVDATPQGTSTVIRNYVATYTFVDVNDVWVEALYVFGTRVRFNQILVTNPAVQQEVELAMAYYQIADPAFSFHVVINQTNVQFFITTAIPVTDVYLDITSGNVTVPLIEI